MQEHEREKRRGGLEREDVLTSLTRRANITYEIGDPNVALWCLASSCLSILLILSVFSPCPCGLLS